MSDLELAMRTIEEPASIDLLDRALRSMARVAAADGRSLPMLTAAVVAPGSIRILPADVNATPIEPFTAVHGGWWTLDRKSQQLLDAKTADDYATPFPTLTTLGTGADGALHLVDLESAGAVTLEGDPSVLRGILAATTLELAAAPWAEDLTIHTVGFAADLASAISGDRIVPASSLDDVLDDLEYRQNAAVEALDADGATDPRHARVAGIAGGAWTPEIVMTMVPISAQQRARLATIASDRRSPLAAVIAASDSEHALPGPWQIQVDESGAAVLPPLGVNLTMQRLTDAQYAMLIEDLQLASDDDSIPCGDFRDAVPAEPAARLPTLEGDALSDAMTDIAAASREPAHVARVDQQVPQDERTDRAELEVLGPEIRVLGPVEMVGAGGTVDSSKRNTLTELAAFLALFPGRSGDQVSETLGAGAPWTAQTRNGNVSRLRKWFGKDHEGNDHVPTMSAGAYRLAESVRTDWHRFSRLVERGIDTCNAGDPDDLERALRLVRGRPFEGRQRKRYLWAEYLMSTMCESIVDVAHTLAVHYTQTARIADARRVIEHALSIEPASELLFRDLMRAEARIGNTAGIHAAEDRLDAINADLGLARETETDQLLLELIQPLRAHG